MEFKNQQAIYLQIADHICEKILKQELPPNERIPSVREFAISVEVNPNTIMRTYGFLEEKGIIYKERGIGYFIANDAFNKTLELKKNVFFTQELPNIFKTMQLLGIKFSELENFSKKYKYLEDQNYENK